MRISTEIHPIWERQGTSWLFRFLCKQTFSECSQMEMNTMQSGNVNCIRRGRGWGWDLTLCLRNPMEVEGVNQVIEWRSLRSPQLVPTVGKQAEGDTTVSGSQKLWSAFWRLSNYGIDLGLMMRRWRTLTRSVGFLQPNQFFFMWEYPQPRCDGYFFLYSFKYLLLSWIVAWRPEHEVWWGWMGHGRLRLS